MSSLAGIFKSLPELTKKKIKYQHHTAHWNLRKRTCIKGFLIPCGVFFSDVLASVLFYTYTWRQIPLLQTVSNASELPKTGLQSSVISPGPGKCSSRQTHLHRGFFWFCFQQFKIRYREHFETTCKSITNNLCLIDTGLPLFSGRKQPVQCSECH